MSRMPKRIRVGALVCAGLAARLMWSWNIDIPTLVTWVGSAAVLVVFGPWLLTWTFQVLVLFTVLPCTVGIALMAWGMRVCGRLLVWMLSSRLLRAIWGDDWMAFLRGDAEDSVRVLDHVGDSLRTVLS